MGESLKARGLSRVTPKVRKKILLQYKYISSNIKYYENNKLQSTKKEKEEGKVRKYDKVSML